eukprot:s1715_g12.t2
MTTPAGGRWRRSVAAGSRGNDGRLRFKAAAGAPKSVVEAIQLFRPTLTPAEVLQAGAFGGTYFRDIDSADLPSSWFKGLDIKTQVACPWKDYDASVNKYGAKCGNTLEDWENAGWIVAQDPYGWFQWYCRFFLGRRTDDDERQIKRWSKVCGPTGRWKGNLVAKCLKAGRPYNDAKVAPAVRQSLLHWGYELTAEDLRERSKAILKGSGAYAMPREQLRSLQAKVPAHMLCRGNSSAHCKRRLGSGDLEILYLIREPFSRLAGDKWRLVAMASRSRSPRFRRVADECGYDENWVCPEEVERFKCPICCLVARDAVSHECGASLFCEGCWTNWMTRDHRCPSCRTDASTVAAAHFDRRTIRNLMLKCPLD